MRWLILLSLFSLPASAEPAPDCRYAGAGTFFALDQSTDQYVANPRFGYQTSAQRIPLGNGKYLLRQVRTYNDGRPPQRLSQARDAYVGPVNAKSPDGKVVYTGYCSRIGHCFGKIVDSGTQKELRYTLDYDADGIHLVSGPPSGEFFVDEILNADEPCAFQP